MKDSARKNWKAQLASVEAGVSSLADMQASSGMTSKNQQDQVQRLAEKLHEVSAALDGTIRPVKVFDPAQPDVASHVVAMALLAQPKHRLGALHPFYGSGVYAIYYNGEFPLYSRLVGTEQPIYVGRSNPKARTAQDAVAQGKVLYKRLVEDHARNIRKATSTLSIADFECRFLIVQTGFESAAETYLIQLFNPVWNYETRVCWGIGKHGDSVETRGNRRSPWDTLHPGRAWAGPTLEDQRSPDDIAADLTQHFEKHQPFSSATDVLRSVLADLRQIAPERFIGVATLRCSPR